MLEKAHSNIAQAGLTDQIDLRQGDSTTFWTRHRVRGGRAQDLDYNNPDFEVIVTVRAKKGPPKT
jgi:23S rRNA G2445 N2-methylase RlmL